MVSKGQRLGSTTTTLGRAESHEHNVSANVSLADIDGVETETPYWIGIKGVNDETDIDRVEFVARTHTDRRRFAIPQEQIQAADLKPGHSVIVTVWAVAPDADEDGGADPEGGAAQGDDLTALVEEIHSMVSDIHDARTGGD